MQARSDASDKIGNEIPRVGRSWARCCRAKRARPRPKALVRQHARAIFKFFAGECLRLAGETIPSVRPNIGVEVTREPIGVVGPITPWNFPIAIPSWKDCTGAGVRQPLSSSTG